MNRLIVTVSSVFLLSASSLLAQGSWFWRGSPKLEEGLITEPSVRSHMEFLASDALNGRGSGTRDEWLAAAYIGSELRRWGVEPLGDNGGYVQNVAIEQYAVAAPPVLSVGGKEFTHGSEIVVLSLSVSQVSGGLQKLHERDQVRPGSVVLLPEGMATGPATAGAAIILTLDTDQARARRQATPARVLTPPVRVGGVPPSMRSAVVALDRNTYSTFAALPDGTPVALDAQLKLTQISHTWNAMGRLTGRAPASAREVVLLTAHLDHLGNRAAVTTGGTPAQGDTIFNGADDDASGSVAVLALAEALANGRRPRRTLIFAWFGSEEAGGFGARHFIDEPPVPLETIVANLEFEMIGRPDPVVPAHTLWLTGYERSNLGPELARHGARLVADPHPAQRFFERSDNIQLARRGVVAQTVSSFGLHTDYHRVSDEASTIDFTHMTDAIRSMLTPILWLANASLKPQWKSGMKPE